MITVLVLLLLILPHAYSHSEFYKFVANDIETGDDVAMNHFRGKVLLIVNVASECGFTENHYREMVDLQRTYDQSKFQVLAFPCNQFGKQEPKKNKYILKFAKKNYDVNFPMFEKVKTIGEHAHPLYKWLKVESSGHEPNWNFNKYLLNHKGELERYASAAISPMEMEKDIRDLLEYRKLKGGKLYFEHFDEEGHHEEL